jgi:hypothetical protein
MSKSWKLLASGLVILLFAAAYLWSTRQQAARTGHETQPPTRQKGPAEVTAPVLSIGQNTLPENGMRTTVSPVGSKRLPIVDAYEKSTDLMTFIESAKRNPADGGYFMASIAASNCALYAKQTLVEIDPSARTAQAASVERREAALKSMQNRCKGYEVSAGNDTSSLLKEGARQGDPIVKLQNDLRSARMEGLLGADQVKQAFALNNPYAIEAAMTAFQASDEKRLLYGGNAIGGDDARYLRLAFQLLPCGFGLDCGPASAITTHDCVVLGGSCDTDRFQQIQGWGVAPREWERVMQYYNEMEYAYRNGDYSIVTVKPRLSNPVPK